MKCKKQLKRRNQHKGCDSLDRSRLPWQLLHPPAAAAVASKEISTPLCSALEYLLFPEARHMVSPPPAALLPPGVKGDSNTSL